MQYGNKHLLAVALAGTAAAIPLADSIVSTPVMLNKRDVPVGSIITGCSVPGTFALTFDDGPFDYTSSALDQLDAAGFKATFFLNGQNFGNIYNYAGVVQRMYNEGHQVGSHTWSHADLATLDTAGITSQMTQVEDALVSIIGVRPTYMRPPYLSTNDAVLSTLGGLGYHVISISIDTDDYDLQDNIPQANANFLAGLNAGGTISLEHDVHANTVSQLIPDLIADLQGRGMTSVTVGTCLGDPSSNWYASARSGGSGTTTPPSGGGSLPVSTDSTCGINTQCPSGQCCSQYGWCGTDADYCGAGCQVGFGNCS